MSLKTALPLVLSLGFHAAVGWSFVNGGLFKQSPHSGPIEISYPDQVRAVPPLAVDPVPKQPPAPKKKIKGIPIPRYTAQSPAPASAPSDFQKKIESSLAEQRAMMEKLDADRRAEKQRTLERPKTSGEMMADPKKGKIYVQYFGEMKKKIQKTLTGRFSNRYSAKGNVTLRFVLNADGYLEKVAISPRDTNEDELLKDMAVQCLRLSAPFGKFPPELGGGALVFDVAFVFDGRSE